jgi:hypothetical protein
MKNKEAYQIIENHFDSKEPLEFMQVRRLLLSVKHNISQEDYQEIYLILGNHFDSKEPLRFSEANRILDMID